MRTIKNTDAGGIIGFVCQMTVRNDTVSYYGIDLHGVTAEFILSDGSKLNDSDNQTAKAEGSLFVYCHDFLVCVKEVTVKFTALCRDFSRPIEIHKKASNKACLVELKYSITLPDHITENDLKARNPLNVLRLTEVAV